PVEIGTRGALVERACPRVERSVSKVACRPRIFTDCTIKNLWVRFANSTGKLRSFTSEGTSLGDKCHRGCHRISAQRHGYVPCRTESYTRKNRGGSGA